MLSWSMAINTSAASSPEQAHEKSEAKSNCCHAGCHHLAVISELIESNRLMSARLLALEAIILKQAPPVKRTEEASEEQASSEQAPPAKRRKKAATNLSSLWFEWYTRLPRVWDSSDRQKKSDYRLGVAYMKLFLDGGFVLREDAVDFKDLVLEVGTRAEAAALTFLSEQGSRAKGAGSVLREMRKLHRSGALDSRIVAYQTHLVLERIVDPTPASTQNILQVVGHV